MRLVLFDNTTYTVTAEQAEKIKQAIDNKMSYITIQGDLIATSAIMKITKGGELTKPALPRPEVKLASRKTVEKIRKQLKNKYSLT